MADLSNFGDFEVKKRQYGSIPNELQFSFNTVGQPQLAPEEGILPEILVASALHGYFWGRQCHFDHFSTHNLIFEASNCVGHARKSFILLTKNDISPFPVLQVSRTGYRSVATLSEVLKAQVPGKQQELAALKKEHGSKV